VSRELRQVNTDEGLTVVVGVGNQGGVDRGLLVVVVIVVVVDHGCAAHDMQ
jgi:hypothetical protein